MKKNFNVCVSPEVAKAIDELCLAEDRGPSYIVERALRQAFGLDPKVPPRGKPGPKSKKAVAP